MNGPEADDTRAVHVPVDSRREPRRDALDAWDSNVAAAAADHVPNPGQHDEAADREADGTSQEVSDRGELVGGYKHDAAERPEEGPEDGVRRRPADVEQEVLSDLVGREVSGSPVVNVRRSTVRTRRHLLRVHRYERPAHPDTVCAAEHADKDEQRNVDPEERLDHTRDSLPDGLYRLVRLSTDRFTE